MKPYRGDSFRQRIAYQRHKDIRDTHIYYYISTHNAYDMNVPPLKTTEIAL